MRPVKGFAGHSRGGAFGNDEEHGIFRSNRLELGERRILVHRHMRPRSGSSLQVRFQHRSALIRGKFFEADLFVTSMTQGHVATGCFAF